MAKGFMDKKQQPPVQQELERLFPSKKGSGIESESRELHRVGGGESSASTNN